MSLLYAKNAVITGKSYRMSYVSPIMFTVIGKNGPITMKNAILLDNSDKNSVR